MFYIRTVNHSSLALYFSSQRFGWAERAAGGRNVLWSRNPGAEGLTGRLWTQGCWAITRPPGVLI